MRTLLIGLIVGPALVWWVVAGRHSGHAEAANGLPMAAARPKNIILLIGDGMGLTQVTAGLYANGNSLQVERFPITGLITTHSAKQLVTDSAAGATAFSCGCKTYNGALAVDNNNKPCRTILEQVKSMGLAAGLVASSSITHATPAAFYAHVGSRNDMESIAAFFVKARPDFAVGGGLRYFQKRNDRRNLVAELQAAGYFVSDYVQDSMLSQAILPTAPFAWFAAWEEPKAVTEGRQYLYKAAAAAPVFLKARSEKGFFLMLEGSQIDWACHANDGPRAVAEMLDFDRAIGAILDFAQADGETLVILTADHETGGMIIENGSELDSLQIAFNTNGHTASLVPVFAYGPGAEYFSGLYDNTDIYHKMSLAWGLPEQKK